MKLISLLPLLIVLGCACGPDRSEPIPRDAVIAGLASVPVVATEPGFEDLSTWLERPFKTEAVLGNWLTPDTMHYRVTLTSLQTSHAEGLTHLIVAVFDPETHERLTDAFHYVADQLLTVTTYRHEGLNTMVYAGRVQQGRYVRYVTGALSFEGGRLVWVPKETRHPADRTDEPATP